MWRHIVCAQRGDNGIGVNGDLLYKYRSDQRFFQNTTAGTVVLMGRRTWQSLPPRGLPGRVTIVLTSDPERAVGADHVVRTVDEAVALWRQRYAHKNVYVIGGARVYEETMALPFMVAVVMTWVHATRLRHSDTRYPEMLPEFELLWTRTERMKDGNILQFCEYVDIDRYTNAAIRLSTRDQDAEAAAAGAVDRATASEA